MALQPTQNPGNRVQHLVYEYLYMCMYMPARACVCAFEILFMAFWGMIRLVYEKQAVKLSTNPFANDSKCMDLDNKECLYAVPMIVANGFQEFL
jgi:hypothetical protein